MADVRLTDGGLETSLIFRQGIELPLFASFPLVESDEGRAALRLYWEPYLTLARDRGVGFIVDTVTWRANADRAAELGYDAQSLRTTNQAAALFARELATEVDDATVSGVVGPRGDGYEPVDEMTAEAAAEYHATQIAVLADAGVDQVAALTINYPQEAIGFVRAAKKISVASVVSFTVETDGRLPSGHSLQHAVELVDAETDRAASGFMINCAHPTHFEDALVEGGDWLRRITGIRANASSKSHAELDAAEDLDDGDPADLAEHYRGLLGRLPGLEVLGGCCGTDYRHIHAISAACLGS